MHSFILSKLIFIPLAGALLLAIISLLGLTKDKRVPFSIGILFSLITFYYSHMLWMEFDQGSGQMQFVEHYHILTSDFLNRFVAYSLGVDGISIYFILLTALLIPICLLISFSPIQKQFTLFVALFLLLEGIIMAVFSVTNFVLFYIVFEIVLVPMFIIIGVWGAEQRVYAALKFFLYTFFGSVFMLVGMIIILLDSSTSISGDASTSLQYVGDITAIIPNLSPHLASFVWICFFIAFAVKIPMFPFHTWLPDAHVQAPTAGSVILAGILLKMGGYGLIRISMPMLPIMSVKFADLVFVLSIIAIIYASFVAYAQTDMKKMIAYSSIAHMGYVTGGLFTFSNNGINGAIIQMISHGIISSALFIAVGCLYNRMHTKEIAFYSGVANKMPKFAFWAMFFTMGSVALPGTSGFIGEIMVMIATFKVNVLYALLMSLGMVLGATYMLSLYKRVVFGELNKNISSIEDITLGERIVFFILGVWVVLIGLYPKIITDFSTASVINLLARF